MDNNDIKQMTRQHIAEVLPDALWRALDSYHAFMRDSKMPDEPGEFSKHHNAAKTAISHIQLLLKLAEWAELPEAEGDTGNAHNTELAQAIREARRDVQKQNSRQEHWEIEGEEDEI